MSEPLRLTNRQVADLSKRLERLMNDVSVELRSHLIRFNGFMATSKMSQEECMMFAENFRLNLFGQLIGLAAMTTCNDAETPGGGGSTARLDFDRANEIGILHAKQIMSEVIGFSYEGRMVSPKEVEKIVTDERLKN